ncbi:hypothetical protein CEXT_530981 [Caerostris extrusa]|uniref:Uncharacterized protein n=1 Tax=Caerostris extrusa TaxID=172846 RepID=A0AAV4RL01_CAEEX|nr:hypothetical protein CEXT_530981 [Caerostris extrusa]
MNGLDSIPLPPRPLLLIGRDLTMGQVGIPITHFLVERERGSPRSSKSSATIGWTSLGDSHTILKRGMGQVQASSVVGVHARDARHPCISWGHPIVFIVYTSGGIKSLRWTLNLVAVFPS